MGKLIDDKIGQGDSIWNNKYFIALIALICNGLWGSGAPTIKASFEMFQIPTTDLATRILFAGLRFSFAGIMIMIYITIAERKFPLIKKQYVPYTALIGFVHTAIFYALYYIGLAYTTGAKGSLFSSVNGFIAVLISPIVYKSEKYTFNKVVGCLLALVGLIVITLDGGLSSLGGFRFEGEGIIFIASFSGAIGFIMTKEFSRKMDVKHITAWELLFGGIMLILIGAFTGGQLQFRSTGCYLIFLYLSFLSAVAFTLWNSLIAKNNVGKISIYLLFTPIFGVFFAGALLNENVLTWQNMLSLVLVSVGAWFVNRREKVKLN